MSLGRVFRPPSFFFFFLSNKRLPGRYYRVGHCISSSSRERVFCCCHFFTSVLWIDASHWSETFSRSYQCIIVSDFVISHGRVCEGIFSHTLFMSTRLSRPRRISLRLRLFRSLAILYHTFVVLQCLLFVISSHSYFCVALVHCSCGYGSHRWSLRTFQWMLSPERYDKNQRQSMTVQQTLTRTWAVAASIHKTTGTEENLKWYCTLDHTRQVPLLCKASYTQRVRPNSSSVIMYRSLPIVPYQGQSVR